MIPRTEKLLITFHTTTDAMAMEQLCRRDGMPGRLVPVPGFITAGCGLAWCAAPEHEDALLNWMQQLSIPHQALHRCKI